MSIFIDSSELKSNSKMPNIEGSVSVVGLEAITGADFMISPLVIPAHTEDMIHHHVNAGAFFVQRKHGGDLVSSMGERLNNSLFKMRKFNVRPSQCILLFIGFLIEKDGLALINNQKVRGGNYFSIKSAISKWCERGGVYEDLLNARMIERWSKIKMAHLVEYQNRPEKEIWTEKPYVQEHSNVLQSMVQVNDARVTLATFPGIGPKLANSLFEHFKGSAAEAIAWLTMPAQYKGENIKGIGPITHEKARKWLNLDEAMWLDMSVIDSRSLEYD